MAVKTKIDLAGYITIPEELRRKYGLHPKALADIVSTDDGLLVRKTAIFEDSSDDLPDSAAQDSSAAHPVKKWPDEGVEYCEATDTLVMADGLIIEQAAQKLRRALYPMMRYLDELDEREAVNISLPVLEDIIRVSPSGQIRVSRDFIHRFSLHPNAEVEITDPGHGLLVRKAMDSENPIERATGVLPPGNIVEQLGGSDAYVRWIRGR